MIPICRRALVGRNFSSRTARQTFSESLTELYTKEEDVADLDVDPEIYDVVVVGGGIVGSALACKLKSSPLAQGKKIGLIERQPPSGTTANPNPDLRSYTITPKSRQVLEEIGVWDKVKSNSHAFEKMQVWDAVGDGFIRFNSQSLDCPELGHVVENKVLHDALHQRIQELTTINTTTTETHPLLLHCPANVETFDSPSDYNIYSDLTLSNNRRIKARLVVAADGQDSLIRSLTGLGTWGLEYDQQAIVATIKTESLVADTAFQRFLPTGPIALLPLRDGFTSVVWTCTSEMAKELRNADDNEFILRLQKALTQPSQSSVAPPDFPSLPIVKEIAQGVHGALTGMLSVANAATNSSDPFQAPPKPVEVVGKRFAFPLKMRHATQYTKTGVALVGDSAHTIHPLAGQGLNLGIADVESLSRHILEGFANGEHIADVNGPVLECYENDRKTANISMALAMDGFKRLFGPNPDFVSVARNVGMGSINAVEPLKNKIMRYAMGL